MLLDVVRRGRSDDPFADLSADGSIEVIAILPKHNASIPSIVGEVVKNGLVEESRIHNSALGIEVSSWLAQYYFRSRNSSGNDLVD